MKQSVGDEKILARNSFLSLNLLASICCSPGSCQKPDPSVKTALKCARAKKRWQIILLSLCATE